MLLFPKHTRRPSASRTQEWCLELQFWLERRGASRSYQSTFENVVQIELGVHSEAVWRARLATHKVTSTPVCIASRSSRALAPTHVPVQPTFVVRSNGGQTLKQETLNPKRSPSILLNLHPLSMRSGQTSRYRAKQPVNTDPI